MPKIERQKPLPAKKAEKPGFRPVPLTEHKNVGVRMLVYGMNGRGKTTFACTFPKPLLLVGFEDGTDSVRGVEGIDFGLVTATADLEEAAETARTGGYATVVLDTATSLQDLVFKEIMGWDSMPTQLGWGVANMDHYRARAERTKEMMRLFFDVSAVNLVVLAQEKNHSHNEDAESSLDLDIVQPFVAAALGASTCQYLHDNVSHICQVFSKRKVVKKVTKVKDKKDPSKFREVTTTQKTDEYEFYLRTQRTHDVYAAKIRADKALKIPEFLPDPSYEKFVALLSRG